MEFEMSQEVGHGERKKVGEVKNAAPHVSHSCHQRPDEEESAAAPSVKPIRDYMVSLHHSAPECSITLLKHFTSV